VICDRVRLSETFLGFENLEHVAASPQTKRDGKGVPPL